MESMTLEKSTPLRGLEDLHWSSITSPEKLVIAGLLEHAEDASKIAHLDLVAEELRDDARCKSPIPLVLTPRQNRAVAKAIEDRADRVEAASERFADQPLINRSGNLVAGYLHSVIDRLIKGAAAEQDSGRERIVHLLLLERPAPGAPRERARTLVEAASSRLNAFGIGNALWPVLEQFAPQAAEQSADDEILDFEIVDGAEERRVLALRAFEAALRALWDDDLAWPTFLRDLHAGAVEGCGGGAAEHPALVGKAASTALAITSAIRTHLQQARDLAWEAVRPGLKAILDNYPALKDNTVLREFVKSQLKRSPDGERADSAL